MTMSQCPSIDQLDAVVCGAAAEDSIANHIRGCTHCQRLIEELRSNSELERELKAADAARSPAMPGAPLQDSIEGYDILSEISRGGQGVVYKATQRSTKRVVALKVLLQGAFATRRQRLRFEREIDLVAGLQHPNIVTVHDSGKTADGRQFVAMEYIEGVRLDEYMSSLQSRAGGKPRSLEPAVRLFRTICDAVSHAHQRGIIHRDLKPGNILVDEQGRPHVLDFGLAKIVDELPETGAGPMTMTGEFLGTLVYASPEQAQRDSAEVDVRSDVYSLGVILYEMLTGQFPYQVSGPLSDVLKAISETPPAPPSSWRHCRSLPRAGIRLEGAPYRLDDEIDTIVLKTLAKEKERRYQSADSLSRDLERYMAGLPIDAKRDSSWYLLKKTLHRYRLAAGIAAALIILVSGFGAMMTILYGRATTAESLAQERLTEVTQARDEATVEARKAHRIRAFLQDMLASVDPALARGDEVLVRDVLDAAAKRIETELANEPDVRAAVQATIGKTYHGLGDFDEAQRQLRAALALQRRHLGDEHPDTAETMDQLATTLEGMGSYEEAESLFRRALELRRQLFGGNHSLVAVSMNNLGQLLDTMGRHREAESLYRKALAIQRGGPENKQEYAAGLNNLGALLFQKGDYQAAEPLYRESLELHRKLLGDDHPDVVTLQNNLAAVLYAKGDHASAASAFREIAEIRRKLLGEDHPDTLMALNNLAVCLMRTDDSEAAVQTLREVLTIQRRHLGEDHADVAGSLNNLGGLLHGMGRHAEAEPLFREALSIQRRNFGDVHLAVATTKNNLATVLQAQHKLDAAEPLFQEAIATRRELAGPSSVPVIRGLSNLASLYQESGKFDEAEKTYRAALEAASQHRTDAPRILATAQFNLAHLLMEDDRSADAEPLIRECLELRQESLPSRHPDIIDAKGLLGACLTPLGRYEEAELLLKTTYADSRDEHGDQSESARLALGRLLQLYEDWDRPDKAAQWRASPPHPNSVDPDPQGRATTTESTPGSQPHSPGTNENGWPR